MDVLMLVVGGTLVLFGVGLGAWGTLYIQRWTLNHSVERTLTRTDPVVTSEQSAWREETPFEAQIAAGEAMVRERRVRHG